MAKVIMVQGTMSNVGKSLLTAGLCRIFKQDGYRVAPFKSQNMALNSYVTADGLELSRAQVIQAEAAGIPPQIQMNPILLKPTSHMGSQVIVAGRSVGNMLAREYYAYKKELIPVILESYKTLAAAHDIIVVEGAGSPAEINLREHDIVNMGLAEMLDAPVVLVGDIDRGGVFAQLLGTLELVTQAERARIKGLIINKFRGDKTLLKSGLDIMEERGHVPVLGVVPYMELNLEDEDSLTERFKPGIASTTSLGAPALKTLRVKVIRYPRISNFTDFAVFDQVPEVQVDYVTDPETLPEADLIILPGSKNTIEDLRWLKGKGFGKMLANLSHTLPILGICGGMQMLGCYISDPEGAEGEAGSREEGLSLLPIETTLKGQKIRKQVEGTLPELTEYYRMWSGLAYRGYEIHMGETRRTNGSGMPQFLTEGLVGGTYIHGILDTKEILQGLLETMGKAKGLTLNLSALKDYTAYKDREYNRLADGLRESLAMEAIYHILQG